MRCFLVLLTAAISATTQVAWAAADAAAAPTVPVVLVSKLKRAALFDELSYPARVIPKVYANVLAESDGVVSRILAPLGSKVARGRPLMIIRHTDPVYQYAPLTVTAPVSGVVSTVDVTEGSLVAKDARLASVTDPSKIRISVEIAAVDLALVHAGLKGELRVNGRADALAVQVRGVSPFVDPATGTATAELEAEKTASPVIPGLVGQVRFKVNEHQGCLLPEYAVIYRDGKTFLRTVENGHAKYAEVQLGRKSRGQIEITSGVAEGTQVIERATSFIADGEAVTARESGT